MSDKSCNQSQLSLRPRSGTSRRLRYRRPGRYVRVLCVSSQVHPSCQVKATSPTLPLSYQTQPLSSKPGLNTEIQNKSLCTCQCFSNQVGLETVATIGSSGLGVQPSSQTDCLSATIVPTGVCSSTTAIARATVVSSRASSPQATITAWPTTPTTCFTILAVASAPLTWAKSPPLPS